MAGYCECGREPSGSMKCGEFLDYLRKELLKARTFSIELMN
jgi:hypothetical protein